MAEEKREKFAPGRLLSYNSFLLIFSFCAALVIWFVMANGRTDSNRIVADVPIEVNYSSAAEEDGLRVFNMSYTSADLEISGSNLITNKLTRDDFRVSVTLNPTSTKLTGNTLQKMTLPVRFEKVSSVSDYNIVTVSPEEVTVEYDRFKEVTMSIENQVTFSADTGYATGAVILSEDTVTISGPESAVNKISRAAVNYSVANPLRADENVTCPVRLFDQNNQEITDTAGMYLEMSVDTLDVAISILPKKTVNLVATTVRRPRSFPDSRIVIEPAQIDIAGAAETLAGISEITLDTVIDFAELDIGQKNVFTVDIPLPAGVRNLSAAGETGLSHATVTVNLNGYKAVTVNVPAANVQVLNKPAGKEITVGTLTIGVTVIGPEAQVSRLTGDTVSIQVDMTNFQESNGNVEIPAMVTLSGNAADSCWVLGNYTVPLQVENAVVAVNEAPPAAAGSASPDREQEQGVAAEPQE